MGMNLHASLHMKPDGKRSVLPLSNSFPYLCIGSYVMAEHLYHPTILLTHSLQRCLYRFFVFLFILHILLPFNAISIHSFSHLMNSNSECTVCAVCVHSFFCTFFVCSVALLFWSWATVCDVMWCDAMRCIDSCLNSPSGWERVWIIFG